MPEHTTTPTPDRRGAVRTDRRKISRSGRRTNDPHATWRRVAWLFGGYALIISLRSVPAMLKKKLFDRSTPTPS